MGNEPTAENLGGDIEGKANLFLVDPNPPGRDVVPNEDLFIYVKLSAVKKKRSVVEIDSSANSAEILDTDGSDGVINFIATSVDKGSTEQTITNSYATTDWTNMGGVKDGSSGILEGFGINSINISFGAALVPKVDITFTDLRGSSLFNVIDSENRQSPYSVFFSLPYPVFKLTVKGYYGKAVTYCLHMVKSNFDFDGSTGNFQIKSNFVGFQQAFLADMVLGNIVGVVNTRAGADALSKLTIKDSNGVEKPTPKIDDFINEVTKISEITKELKADSDSFQSLKTLNTEISKLKRFISLFGKPVINSIDINIDNKVGNDTSVNKGVSGGKSNVKASKQLLSDEIGYSSLIEGTDYVIIRDLLIVKHVMKKEFLDFVEKTYNLYEDYVKFEKTEATPATDNPFTLYPFEKSEDESADIGYSFTEFFSKLKEPGDGDTFRSIYNDQLTITGTEKLGDIWLYDFDFKSLKEQKGNYFGAGKFSNDGDDKVFAVDLYPFRNELETTFINKKSQLDEIQKKAIIDINEKLSKKLTFNPYIREVVNVFTNNTQAMLSTIYDVSINAEKYSSERYDILNKVNPASGSKGNTDTPTNNKTVYAWPEIIENLKDGEKSRWIGDVLPKEDDKTYLFPEISFVEEVVDAYLTSSARVNADSEIASKGAVKEISNNWYPITPYGYKSFPYIGLNQTDFWDIKTKKGVPESLIVEIIDRVIFLTNTSKYNDTLKNYALLDGAYSGINTKDKIYAQSIIENLNGEEIIEYAKDNQIIKPISGGDDNYLKDTIASGSFIIDGETSCDNSYLYIGKDFSNSIGKSILQNTLDVSPKISGNGKAKKAIGNINKSYKTNGIKNGIKYFNVSYKLPTHNISYLVWGDTIFNKIKPPEGTNDINYILPFKSINDFDGSAQNGQSNNNFIGFLEPEKQNIFKSDLYSGQTNNESQALLLLNTLPFDNPNKIIPLLGDVAKVIKLPKYYLLWLCGSIWRYEESSGVLANDPIIWSGSEVGQTSPSNFLYNVGKNKIYGDTIEGRQIPSLLLTLPPKTKELLINYYKRWVKSELVEFSRLMESYLESLEPSDQLNNEYTSDINSLINDLKEQTTLISTTPNLWNKKLNGNIVETDNILTYVNEYKNSFINFWKPESIQEKSSSENDDGNNNPLATTNNSDLKNAFYKYFKNIYDKWIGGSINGKDMYNACAPNPDDNLINYFKFINRSWCDIGDNAAVNLNSVATLSGDYDINMYFYLAKVLRDSNFLLQILPTYINFKDEIEVEGIFKPTTSLDPNSSGGPIYTCIYAGGSSKSLEIEDSDYSNDGMDFDTPQAVPSEFTNCNKPTDSNGLSYNLVAFRVAFGAENQSIFKNLNLNQEEHRETGEYFKVLTELIDNRGGSKRTYQGTDLYQIYQARSYKCKVESLGCMNIQPLMYFQLDNVPFFRGAYLITNVTHSITPNHISTNFEGVRQSSVSTPIIDTATTFLNLNLTEEFASKKIDQKPINRNPAPWSVQNPDNVFDKFTTLTAAGFRRLGITQTTSEIISDDTGTDSEFKKILIKFKILTNSQVTMFLASVLYESSNMTITEEVWNTPNIDDNRIAQNGSRAQLAYENSDGVGGLGNTEDGDGYKFRGRGAFLLTGRDQYQTIKGDNDFKQVLEPFITGDFFDDLDVMVTNPVVSLASAASFWKKNEINEIAKGGKSASYTELFNKINGEDYKHSTERYSVFSKVLDILDLKDEENI